jgi:hypothetical protein
VLLDVVFPCRLDRLKNNFVWLVDSWKINQFNLLRLSVALGETGTQTSVDCIGTCRAAAAATAKTSACGRCIARATGWRIKCKRSDQRRYVTRINLDGKMLFFTLQIKAKVTSMKKNCFSKSLERHVLTVYDVDLAWNLTIKEKGNCLRVHWWMSAPSFKSLSKMFFCFVVVFEERYNSNCLNTQDNSLN